MEIYYADVCPQCKAKNFISGGDPDDLTDIDTDGIECYKCGKEWLFEDGKGRDVDETFYYTLGCHAMDLD